MQFKDRSQAGCRLAAKLNAYRRRKDVIVFALPRGGVAVGYEVAVALQAPLDVLVVRKVGLPGFPEMAIGALASGGIETLSRQAVERFQVPLSDLQKVLADERRELSRQEQLFRENRPFPKLHQKTVILVDDGLATGHTMKAAIATIRGLAPGEIVVAVPVGSTATCRRLARDVNQLICLSTPLDFAAVGAYYEDFHQVDDAEVLRLLAKANENLADPARPVETPAENRNLTEKSDPMLFVKTARIKLSQPQTVEMGLSNGRVVRVMGEAAREPIHAIEQAAQSRDYHGTFGLPVEGGKVLVVGVDGKNLKDTLFNN